MMVHRCNNDQRFYESMWMLNKKTEEKGEEGDIIYSLFHTGTATIPATVHGANKSQWSFQALVVA